MDVVARGKAWTTARLLAHEEVHAAPFGPEPIARFWGLLEVSCGWISRDWDIDELIDTAEYIDGLPFVRLEYVLRYKLALNREKDQADIAALRRHLEPDKILTH